MANNRDDMNLNDELDHDDFELDEEELDEEELTSSWHDLEDDDDESRDRDADDVTDNIVDTADDETLLSADSDNSEYSNTSNEDIKPAQNPMPLIAGAAVAMAGVVGGGYYLMSQGDSSTPVQTTQVAEGVDASNHQVPALGDTEEIEKAIAETNTSPTVDSTASKEDSLDKTMQIIEELKEKIIALEEQNASIKEQMKAQKAHYDKMHRQLTQQLKEAQLTNKKQDRDVVELNERVSALEEKLESAIAEVEREVEIAQRASEQGVDLSKMAASDRWKLERKVDMTEHEHDAVAPVTGDRWRMKGYQIVSWNDAGDKVLMRTSTGKTFTFKVGEHIKSPVYGVHKVTAIEEGGKRMLVGDKYVVDTTYVKLPGATLYGAIPSERAAMKAAGYDSPESYVTNKKTKAPKALAEPVIKEEIVKGFVAVGIGPNGVIVRTEQSDQPFILVKHGTEIEGFGVVTRVEKDGTIKSGNKIIESNIK